MRFGNPVSSVTATIVGTVATTGPANNTVTGTLNGINTSITEAMQNYNGAAFTIAPGSLVGTVQAFVSFDGGTSYVQSLIYDPSQGSSLASVVVNAPVAALNYAISVPSGATHVQIKVTAYTSGSCNASMTITAGVQAPIAAVAQGDTNAVTISALPVGALGNSSDGIVTISVATSLTRDMQYAALTNNSTLTTNSWTIRCSGTVSGNGTFQNSGSAASGSTAGAGAPTGSMGGGTNGAPGLILGTGVFNQAVAITLPGLASNSPNADIQGGTGGTGGGGSVNAGPAGSPVPALINSYTPSLRLAGGSGGSSGGFTKGTTAGTSAPQTGGGGGAGGAIYIICGTWSFTGNFVTTGGAGGNGSPTNATSTSGGGGGGGGGPVLVVFLVTATVSTLTVNSSGGAAGSNGQISGGSNNTVATSGDSATSKQGRPAVRFL